MISFTIPIAPVAKERPRVTRYATYTPSRTARYEAQVALYARQAMKGQAPLQGPLEAHLAFFLPIPVSWKKSDRADAASGKIRPTGKPDLDNLIKSCCDAMISIVYKDDSQITVINTVKAYDASPRVGVTVRELK